MPLSFMTSNKSITDPGGCYSQKKTPQVQPKIKPQYKISQYQEENLDNISIAESSVWRWL